MIPIGFAIGIAAEIISFFYAVYRKEPRRSYGRREGVLFLLAGCCVLLINCLPLDGILPAEFSGYAAGFFLAAALYESSLLETVKYYSIAFFGISMLNTMMISVMRQMFHRGTDTMQLLGVAGVLAFLWIYFLFVGRRYDHTNFMMDRHIGILMLMITIIESFTIAFALFVSRVADNKGIQSVGAVLLSLGGGVLFILCFAMLRQINVTREARQHSRMMEAYNEQQRNYFFMLLEKNRQTQKLRHDYQAHLVVLGNYLKTGEYEKMKCYLEEMGESAEKIRFSVYDVGNEIVNVILNHYLNDLFEAEYQINVSGQMSEKLSISQRDLCIIVSNLVRNAVEALKGQSGEKPFFTFRVSQSYEELCFFVVNSSESGIKGDESDGRSLRSKKGGGHSGFGMQNIRETAEQNGGAFFWRAQEGIFEAKVVLPLEEE